MTDNNVTCKECNKVFTNPESIRRHVKIHEMTFQEYYLKWECDGNIPLCKCGCQKETSWNVSLKRFADFVRGHHAFGREKSDDEKRRIGEKNSINQKRFFKEHPDACAAKVIQLRAGLTPDVEKRRIDASNAAYKNMTSEDKQQFSDHGKKLWADGTLRIAHEKATTTYKRKFAAGEYDFTERNEKLSNSISQKYVDGKWKFAKGRHNSQKTGKQHYYRSSWELKLMQEFDTDDDVIMWESEFMRIPFEFNGKCRNYVPDFHVIRKNCEQLVEVKPMSLRVIPKNVAKRAAVLVLCNLRGWEYLEWCPNEESVNNDEK